MTRQLFTFRKQFLVPQNFEKAKQNSAKLNTRYEQLINLFERQFAIISSNRNNILRQGYSLQAGVRRKKYMFSNQLKDFIAQFIDIMEQQAQYQIQCLNSLKDNNASSLEIFFKLLQKVKENKVLTTEIQLKTITLFQKYSEIKATFNSAKQMFLNPLKFYKKQAVSDLSRNLNEKIVANNQLIEEIVKKKIQVQEKIEDFEPYLTTFRKRLIKNKYETLERITKLITNIKNSYLLLADTIKNCATSKKVEFERICSNQKDDITYLKQLWIQIHDPSYLEHPSQENRNWEKMIYQSVEELSLELKIIEQAFLQLVTYFNTILNYFTQEQLNLKPLLSEISTIFTENQFPKASIDELLNVQDIFVKKTNKIIIRLQDALSKIRLQKSNYKKQSEMFLTLIKVNKHHGRAISEGSKQQQNEEIIKLIDQLTFSNMKKIILTFYDDCTFLPNQLLDKFEKQFTKKITRDSMEISHSYFGYICPIDKFTPLKEERWLWKQWKTQAEISFESYLNFFKEVQQYLQKAILSVNVKQSPVLEKESCILLFHKGQIPGELILKAQSLQFVSQSLHLSIKLTEVSQISFTNGVFKDILALQTEKGVIQLFKLQRLQTFSISIKQAQQKAQTVGIKIQKKPLLALSSQEMQFIKQRREKIKPQLPNIDNYIKIKEVILSQRIDQIYQIVYSDNPFSFYGKQQPCFFSYTGKKSGNFEWAPQKYDKPGPEFYTSNKQVSFKNCPTSSTRIIKFKHPMKRSSIPLMPDHCNNTDTRKIFWVSNEELIYQIESLTEGVPYADHFLVFILHRITALEKGVKLEIFYSIKWLKKTMMKSAIQSSIVPQLTQSMNYFVNQVEKVLRLRGEIQRGEASAPQKPEEEHKQNPAKSEVTQDVSKVKFHNKLLIIALLVLLLINIVSYFVLGGTPST